MNKKICKNCVYTYSKKYWLERYLPCYNCDTVKYAGARNNFKSMEIFYNQNVVAKMVDYWYLGSINYDEIHDHLFQVEDFILEYVSEVKDIDKYISLKEFMKKHKIDTKFENDLLRQFEVEKMYLKEKGE